MGTIAQLAQAAVARMQTWYEDGVFECVSFLPVRCALSAGAPELDAFEQEPCLSPRRQGLPKSRLALAPASRGARSPQS